MKRGDRDMCRDTVWLQSLHFFMFIISPVCSQCRISSTLPVNLVHPYPLGLVELQAPALNRHYLAWRSFLPLGPVSTAWAVLNNALTFSGTESWIFFSWSLLHLPQPVFQILCYVFPDPHPVSKEESIFLS